MRNIMFCAHPDDETLFGAQELLQSEYLVVCVTSINRFDMETKNLNDFINNMTTNQIKYQIWDYKDDGFTNAVLLSQCKFGSDNDKIKNQIINILSNENFDKIVTHNNNGEYGHPQHIGLSELVFTACKHLNLLNHLYYFDLTEQGKQTRKQKQIVHRLSDKQYLEIIYDKTINNINNDDIITKKKIQLCKNYTHASSLLLGLFNDFVLYSCISKNVDDCWKTDYVNYKYI